MSRSLYEIRARLDHRGGITSDHALAHSADGAGKGRDVTSKDLRNALNASAIYWNATDWDPTKPVSNETIFNVFNQAAPTVFPAAQLGWGYVNGSLVPAIVQRVLDAAAAPPANKGDAVAFQAQYQAAREEYWSRAPG
jgi:hypothetical protein